MCEESLKECHLVRKKQSMSTSASIVGLGLPETMLMGSRHIDSNML